MQKVRGEYGRGLDDRGLTRGGIGANREGTGLNTDTGMEAEGCMQKAEGRTRTRRADAGKHRSPTAARSPRPAQRRAARTERGHGRGRGAAVLGAGPPPAATRPFPGAGSAADTERLAPLPAQMAAVSPRGPAPRRPPLATKAPPRRGGGYRGAPPSSLPGPRRPPLGAHLVPGRAPRVGSGSRAGGGKGGRGGAARAARPLPARRSEARAATGREGGAREGEESAPPRPAPPGSRYDTPPRCFTAAPGNRAMRRQVSSGALRGAGRRARGAEGTAGGAARGLAWP